MSNKKETQKIGWNFDNSYSGLPELLFTRTSPSPVQSPELIIFNEELSSSLGLDNQALKSVEGVNELAGNKTPEDAVPLAQAYAGHQFGNFTMLGDGRVILLGEQITPNGKRFDIQLKGSGRTPYSRQGDGRSGLGPMLREYIISEAIYNLGIPTTRSLAVVATGEPVMREKIYPGGVLTRVAASHIRVGTFEYVAKRGGISELRALADYTLERHFPSYKKTENQYLLLLQEVIKQQASLIAKWQLVGFIHGVMNTDNMSISGETIDYGPCAFMDTYNSSTVFSSIDRQGRYSYDNQAYIGGWNLARFAECLVPLLHEEQEKAIELAQEALAGYTEMYHYHWLTGMRNKLGIYNEELEDEALINKLLDLMEKHHADYTNTFLALTFDKLNDSNLSQTVEFKKWHELWKERLDRQQETIASSRKLMQDSNPAIIPRNHRVEEALDVAVNKGDYSVMKRLLHVLSNPYAHSPEQSEYATPPEPSNHPYQTFCGT